MEQKAGILDRILSLKDYSPFILVCDSLAQTADKLISEIEFRRKRDVVYLHDLQNEPNAAQKIQQHIQPGIPVVGIVHTDREFDASMPHTYAPHGLPLLEYMATSIIRIHPHKEAQQRLADDPVTGIFDFSDNLYNLPQFRVDIEHRRKTGRSLVGTFEIDAEAHKSQFVSPQTIEEEVIPENLTTFNLSLNEKQKQDRENLQLPFMEAQQGPEGGGAIVYQFEKDDDYDEEDPYEDPF